MATPTPAKKQKTSRPPIIFKSPGLIPDVRFKIFDEYEFHVHSVILKLGSAFFRKFLDPANKNGTTAAASASPPAPTSAFQYEWVSKLDDDKKDWHLVCDTGTDSPNESGPSPFFTRTFVIPAFTNLLRSFYREELVISNAQDIVTLTKLADYYCALKVVSHSLNGILLTCPYFKDLESLRENAYRLVSCASKLRNKILFKELVVLLAGEWPEPEYFDLGEVHKDIVDKAHARLCVTALHTYWRMDQQLISNSEEPDRASKMRDFMEKTRSSLKDEYGDFEGPAPYLPEYYRKLLDGPFGFDDELVDFDDFLGPIMKNNLILNYGAESGLAGNSSWFFAAEVPDSELPWNVVDAEMDW